MGMDWRRVDGYLYERELHVAAIDKLLESARHGHGGALVLSGPAGCGKTSLLSIARQLAGPRFDRRYAAGSPMERDLAWVVARDLFQTDLGAKLGAKLGADPGADPGADRIGPRTGDLFSEVSARILDWLTCRHGDPLLLCVDDLHFADPRSLNLLCYAARRASRFPVAMVISLRPWPPDALTAMATVAAGSDVHILQVPPLGKESSLALLRSFLGTSEPDEEEELILRSQGNPLLIEETAKASLHATRQVTSPLDASSSPYPTLLVSQLAGLPPDAVTCARASAVLGEEVSRDLLEAVSMLRRDRFVETCDALVAAGVLLDDGDGQVTVANAAVAGALERQVAPAARERIFRRAFEHLYHRGRVEQAVGYIERANLQHDHRAVDALESAGSNARERGALDEALTYLGRAVAVSEPRPSTKLLMLHADALYAAGHSAEAAAEYSRLLASAPSDLTRFDVMSKCVQARTYSGTLHEALSLYETLVKSDSPQGPHSSTIWLERAHVIWEIGGPRRALDAIGGIPAGADQDPMVALARAFFALETGDPSGIGALEAAGLATRRHALTDPSELGSFTTLSLWVNSLAAVERYDEALDVVDFGVGWLRSAGSLRATVPLRIARLGILSLAGRMHEIVGEVELMRRTLALDALSEPHVAIFEADAFANMGETSRAETLLAEVATMPGRCTWFAAMNGLCVRARCLLDRGDADGAVEAARELEVLTEEHGVGTPSSPPWAAVAAEAYLAARHHADALRIAAWLESRPPVLAPAWRSMLSLSVRAEHAGSITGDRCLAKDLYRQALDSSGLQPLHRARIGLRFGQFLRQSGEPARARPVLADVLAAAERSGASLLSASAHAELTAAGGRRQRANRPTGLTPQEQRVADLALTGATTRQIALSLHLSPRTVESHLAGIYRKLGVTSRRELLVKGHTSDA